MQRHARLAAVLAVLALTAAAAREGPKGRHHRLVGELTAVDGDANTFTLKVSDKQGERTIPFTTTDKTNVVIETDEDEVATTKAADGHDVTVRMPKLKDGTFADLKAGQRVTVSTYDDKVATLITVRRAPKQ